MPASQFKKLGGPHTKKAY